MRIEEIGIRDGEIGPRLFGRIRPEVGPVFELYFEYPEAYRDFLLTRADPFLAVLLQPCMLYKEDLTIDVPISRTLIENIVELQDIYTSFYPYYHRIQVHAPYNGDGNSPKPDGVGAFFSMGVDSFYTLIKNQKKIPSRSGEISHLIYMEGVEMFLYEKDTCITKRLVENIAEEVGKPIICGRTNLRDQFPLDWKGYCGDGLAAVALSLSGGLGTMLIPSSFPYTYLIGSGNHPIVNALWSNEKLRIITDGCESTRAEKIVRLISKDPLALRNLRVCAENDGLDTNCGSCNKCVSTMLVLAGIGQLENAERFPKVENEELVKKLKLTNIHYRNFTADHLRVLKDSNGDPVMINLIESAMVRDQRWRLLRELAEVSTPFKWMQKGYHLWKRLVSWR